MITDEERDEILDLVKQYAHDQWAGCSVGRGWMPFVAQLTKEFAEIDPTFRFTQVKQKFGTLTVYFSSDTSKSSELRAILTTYICKTDMICEACGLPGKPRPYTVFCEKCRSLTVEAWDYRPMRP